MFTVRDLYFPLRHLSSQARYVNARDLAQTSVYMRFDVICGIGMTKRQVKVQDASTTGNKPIAYLIHLSILKYYNNIIIKRQLIEKR